ncbi:MAG TPA: hypothetical protein VN285_08375 [Candidatus Deferrimicrobium sp.]|nr:hypothetical protein [Candidatus Deferrimicrobium sp.]
MVSRLLKMVTAVGLIALAGCEEDNNPVFDQVPAAPQGVFSVTGDKAVYLYWYGPYEGDIREFIVWRSFDSTTGYTQRGRRAAEPNPNLDLIQYEYIDEGAGVNNGETYYYAVSSVDKSGQVSELSAEEVRDTPRPEGIVVLYDVAIDPDRSGFVFTDIDILYVDTTEDDGFIDRVGDIFYLNVGNDTTDLQDMGYTDSFDDIGSAPLVGWSELGWAEIIVGHTYVIWTSDDHYAKMRVESTGTNSVRFQWAYQIDFQNPQLVGTNGSIQRPVHDSGYLRYDNKATSIK